MNMVSVASNLLYITNGINGSGGLERVLSIKASLLADKYPYNVYILGLNQGNDHLFYTFSDKITFISLAYSANPFKAILDYKSGIQAIVAQIKPAIIMVCDDGLKGFFVPKLVKNIPVIYERHASIALNTNSSFKGKLQYSMMQYLAKSFSKFVVLTHSNKLEWPNDNLMVIPNPLSFDATQKSNLSSKKIIAVGSHSPNKGYDRLLAVWEIIARQYPDWHLEIYGKIDAERTYVSMAENMGLERIHFFSPTKDIQAVYEQAAILALPSRSEGFGMVLVEAMACGVPCVSFDCPSGPRDIITDGVDGYLVPNDAITTFATKISLLMANDSLRMQMGTAAYENAKRYQADKIVHLWHELFKSLLL